MNKSAGMSKGQSLQRMTKNALKKQSTPLMLINDVQTYNSLQLCYNLNNLDVCKADVPK